MAYKDEVVTAVQQMATDLRKMRDRLDELYAAPNASVRAEAHQVLNHLEALRADVAKAWAQATGLSSLGGGDRFSRTGLLPRIPSDEEREREARAAKAVGPAVHQVDDSTRVVKRRECNCGAQGVMLTGLPPQPMPHAKDCPMHPSQLERTLRETGATPDGVAGQDFNRAAPRPSDKHYVP